MKHLYRSRTNKVWEGVLGGFGEYFNVDPTLLRVIFVLFVIVTGVFPGVFGYIIAIFIMPRKPNISSDPESRDIPEQPVSKDAEIKS